jgi:hypothetical protein
MVYKQRWRKCSTCGAWTHGTYPAKAPVGCTACNLANAKDAALQMANKSGPHYDRWLATRGPQGRPRTY